MSSSVNRSVDYVKVVDALADVVKELNRGAPAEFAREGRHRGPD